MNITYWKVIGMRTEYDKFVDAFIEHCIKATGMTREELLKGWSSKATPEPKKESVK